MDTSLAAREKNMFCLALTTPCIHIILENFHFREKRMGEQHQRKDIISLILNVTQKI